MEIKLKASDLPENIKKAEITAIKVKAGDQIKAGEKIIELEANKTTISLTTEQSGKIEEILVEKGTAVEVGTVLMKIDIDIDQKESEAENNKQPQKNLESQITIIGGGPGGYVAALKAAKMGADVTLIEKENLGGTCLNWGCIPTKALVRSAEIYNNLKNAAEFGCRAENIDFKWDEIIGRKNKIVNQLTNGIKSLLSKHKVEVITGRAEIVDKNTVLVVQAEKELIINTANIIIATGSKPIELPITTEAAKEYLLYSKKALALAELPQKMAIIGGGVIGLEFAFIFSRLDVEVTIIEYLEEVLSFLDPDVIEEISEAAAEAGIEIYTGAEAKSVAATADNQALIEFEVAGHKNYITADKVLMAVGRQPDLGGLDLEKIGVILANNTGGIEVNEKMQTAVDNIYAIGDCTGKTQLAHAASHQGIIAVKNILNEKAEMDYNVIPTAVFTAPEIATVGLTEKEAANKGLEVKIGKFPVMANGKALTLGETRGFVKIISDAEDDSVLGGTIVGPHATDLIAEITLAVNNGLTTEAIIDTIHAHPTSAESIHEAALALRPEGALHYYEE
ncbi:dihydrolipoamide dehydrogenase [Halanaerobium congolense]|jgi:dihydrolipoamide dehydrogenase|uniref:Dihydrolipoyl dehydrogenase n=3 Tax=Halanaerobium congolense TaxID=54121 RepID=A0A1G8SD52_9FIRM|nr:dihydrolipoyl dehydrogenase [Halanaerobium congolense]SDJ27101.1 dihydrolipoamide dehydrogenase [Halanaerobium congolense]SET81299.1 dihydrolipoamide dehydrogenase [Halanaerobium congolense]